MVLMMRREEERLLSGAMQLVHPLIPSRLTAVHGPLALVREDFRAHGPAAVREQESAGAFLIASARLRRRDAKCVESPHCLD